MDLKIREHCCHEPLAACNFSIHLSFMYSQKDSKNVSLAPFTVFFLIINIFLPAQTHLNMTEFRLLKNCCLGWEAPPKFV